MKSLKPTREEEIAQEFIDKLIDVMKEYNVGMEALKTLQVFDNCAYLPGQCGFYGFIDCDTSDPNVKNIGSHVEWEPCEDILPTEHIIGYAMVVVKKMIQFYCS